jgi:hypothetical protein
MSKIFWNTVGIFFVASIALATYSNVQTGPLVTSWTACTVTSPTATNSTFLNVFCSQEGDRLRVEGEMRFTGAGGAGAVFRIQLPSGYVINTAKLPNGTATGSGEASSAGFCTAWDDASVGYRVVCPTIYDTGGTQNQVKWVIGGGDILDSDLANGDSFNFKIEVPVR